MLFGDLLKYSKWMAILALILCSLATGIAYYQIDAIGILTLPLMIVGAFIWLLSVIWFLWGWLKNANQDSSEKKGVIASSYILAFLPVCYCFLMATDNARTKITVRITNEGEPIHSVKVYPSGSIFLSKSDTLTSTGLANGESLEFSTKAATVPGSRGEIRMEYTRGNEKFNKQVAGPFSIEPLNLRQDWDIKIN
jgi:hypothetical protein